MYIATVPNRNSPPAFLLRESFRQGGKVKNRTLANLSHWPAACLCLLHYRVDEKTTVTKLAQPDARQQTLLQALDVTLPKL
jgi:hypothetical protein